MSPFNHLSLNLYLKRFFYTQRGFLKDLAEIDSGEERIITVANVSLVWERQDPLFVQTQTWILLKDSFMQRLKPFWREWKLEILHKHLQKIINNKFLFFLILLFLFLLGVKTDSLVISRLEWDKHLITTIHFNSFWCRRMTGIRQIGSKHQSIDRSNVFVYLWNFQKESYFRKFIVRHWILDKHIIYIVLQYKRPLVSVDVADTQDDEGKHTVS